MAYERHFKIQNATCLREKVDPFSSPSNKLLDHLLNLVNEGKADGSERSVNSLNTVRSAISTIARINGIPAGQNEVVCLFMRSAAKHRSKLLKCDIIWILT